MVATAPRVGPTFAMLAGATVRVGCEASHPNGKATDGRLCKAYNASAIVARLACSNSLLLVYLEGLLQVLSSTAPAEGSESGGRDASCGGYSDLTGSPKAPARLKAGAVTDGCQPPAMRLPPRLSSL